MYLIPLLRKGLPRFQKPRPDNSSTMTSYPPRAYRFAASKKASMTTEFCSLDSGKCGVLRPCSNNEKSRPCAYAPTFPAPILLRQSMQLSSFPSRRTRNHNNSSLIHLYSPSQFKFCLSVSASPPFLVAETGWRFFLWVQLYQIPPEMQFLPKVPPQEPQNICGSIFERAGRHAIHLNSQLLIPNKIPRSSAILPPVGCQKQPGGVNLGQTARRFWGWNRELITRGLRLCGAAAQGERFDPAAARRTGWGQR